MSDQQSHAATDGRITFLRGTVTSPNGATLDVLLVEDPPGYFRPATNAEERMREAIASALTSLATGPLKDGYAYAVLEGAVRNA